MDNFSTGLRCQDINLGLREVDPTSGQLHLVSNTQLVGMAADLAGLIRGRNVIENIDALRIVSSEALSIPPIAFSGVIELLESADMVIVDRNFSHEARIIESVPIFRDLYADLGNAWKERKPRQIEEEFVSVVDRLARGPIAVESLESELGVDAGDIDRLYRLGVDSSVFRTVDTADGSLLYSPYTAFENPSIMREVMMNSGPEVLAEIFERVSTYQGLPVDAEADPVLSDAVQRGLIAAPGVVLPDGELRTFAALPYMVDKVFTREKKMILDKALAIVACIRCGQHFGGATATRDVGAVMHALFQRSSLGAHSSHERQYKLLRDMGIIRFLPDNRGRSWVRPSFIHTEENDQAMEIAMSLISGEEVRDGREHGPDVKALLDLDAQALRPLQAAARTRVHAAIPPRELDRAFEDLMGRGAL